MKVVTTFYPSSSVVHSLKCHLTSDRSTEHLVVAKINRLDVFSAQPEGLKHECSVDIWGRVASIKAVASSGSQDNLLLLTDHPDPRIIVLTCQASKDGELSLNGLHTINLEERNARPAEFLQDVVVDASRQVAVASCYAGKLKVIVLEGDKLDIEFDVTLPEFSILSLAFIFSGAGVYALAILHLDFQKKMQLISRDLDIAALELSPAHSLLLPPTTLSTSTFPFTETPPMLITVPPISYPSADPDEDDNAGLSGGVLVVGGRKIQLFEFSSKAWQEKYKGKQKRLESMKKSKEEKVSVRAKEKEREREAKKRKAKAAVSWPWSEVTAWCPITDNGTRYVLGDDYGRLALLSLDRLQDQGLLLLPLGEVSPPTTLTYLGSQMMYLGSHLGDSQLLRIHQSAISTPDSPTLPIPPDVVTIPTTSLVSSGKGKGKTSIGLKKEDGRVVMNKGNFLEVVDTWKNIAPIMDAVLADTDGSGQPDIVTCSGGKNTGSLRVLRNGADFHERAVVEGLPNLTSIFSIRFAYDAVPDSHLLVCDGQETMVFKLNSADSIARVDSSETGFITKATTLAAGNVAKRTKKPGSSTSTYENSQFVVQVSPKRVVLVEYDATLGLHRLVSEWAPEAQGADWNGKEIVLASVNSSQVVLALSGGRVAVLNLTDEAKFKVVGHRDLASEIAAISCSPINPSEPFSRYIAVGLWDPRRVEILTVASSKDYLGRESHIAGGFASLAYTRSGGRTYTVVAFGNRAAVLFWGKGRLQHSPVSVKNVSAASRLFTPWWQSCMIMATLSGLSIGSIHDLDKMHIRTMPLGLDSPRRLAYSPSLKAFGVGCVRTEPGRIGDVELASSSFKVLDDTSFELFGEYKCEGEYEVTALQTLTTNDGDSYWCLGTTRFKADEKEPMEGKIHILTAEPAARASGSPQLRHRTAIDVTGCIYQLALIDGLIAAAINSSVVIFKIEVGQTVVLSRLCAWNHDYLITSLASRGSHLIVGDAISSVSVLMLAPRGESLTTVARDYGPLWPVSVEAWGERGVIGANSDCNLFTFTVQRAEKRDILDRDGLYHVGDLVNKILLGSIHSSEVSQDIDLESKALFFTASGRIGVIVDMGEELSLQMTALQRNLGKVITDVAKTPHTRWRAPAGARGRTDADGAAYGFLDGDLLEQFMNYEQSAPLMARILSGDSEPERLTQQYADIRRVLETLQSMH
ncbi:hypothetical protein EW146_g835 [Bondarzewia mesenterica]|uniref:DNA damage-binding protein 1 n=1 Tax=Bondarzewia mesenterica TaxID=1095465 RepID=A0A4S4M7Z9_9AGAM|nr:hypothetical protein EW146_g835 [Bondarzewia mesenterica]